MPAPRSKSAKKPSPLDLIKEEIAGKQVQIDNLNKEISTLKALLNKEVSEEKRLRQKLTVITPEILAHRDRDKYPLEPLNDVVEVDAGYIRCMIQQMIDDLRGRQSTKTLIEERLEQLEDRIVEQNNNYQGILRKNLRCMEGIDEALKCSSAYEMKFAIKRLKQDLLLEEPMRRPVTAPASSTQRGQLFNLTQLPPNTEQTPIGHPQLSYLQSMESANVYTPRPSRKYSGTTHIKHIIPDLKQAICVELNVERPNRGDWRHFAHLIGISTETIQFWRRLDLDSPMDQVINFWKDNPSADVVTLHRLLMSPQLKAYRLAKTVSEFYLVD